MPELLELYDADMRPTGKTIVRGEPIPAGCSVIVVHIMTVNRSGKILATKRAPKKTHPGWWEITGGAMTAGETPAQAACRELLEETGISVTAEMLRPLGTDYDGKWFHTRFLVYAEEPAEGIRLQPGETVDYRWVTPREFCQMLHENDPSGAAQSKIMRTYGKVLAGIENGKDDSK